MVKSITFAAALAATLAFGSSNSSAQSKCDPVATAAPADKGFKALTLHRPAVGEVDGKALGDFLVEVAMPKGMGRLSITDDGPARVIKIYDCTNRDGDAVRFQVYATSSGDFDVTRVPLPADAKNIKVRSCSGKAKACWAAVFDGDFTKPLELKLETLTKPTAAPQAPAPAPAAAPAQQPATPPKPANG